MNRVIDDTSIIRPNHGTIVENNIIDDYNVLLFPSQCPYCSITYSVVYYGKECPFGCLDSPIDKELMKAIRRDLGSLEEWLVKHPGDYIATQDHNNDGVKRRKGDNGK